MNSVNSIIMSLILAFSNVNVSDITIKPVYEHAHKHSLSYDREYKTIINSIKSHEGFVATPYKCPAGYLTIGYGHLIKNDEYFTEISEKEAEMLLKQDFNKCLKFAKTLGFSSFQELAIANFVYAKGCGRFLESNLYKLILSNAPQELLEKEFLKWCYYKDYKTGKTVFNQKMYNNQKYNCILWMETP